MEKHKINSFNNNNQAIYNDNKTLSIDMSIKAEFKVLTKIKKNFNCDSSKLNFFNQYINYRLAKHVFYKLWDLGEFNYKDYYRFDFNEAIKTIDF